MDCSKCDGKLAAAKVYDRGGRLAQKGEPAFTLYECFLRRITSEFELVDEKMEMREENLKLKTQNKALLMELADMTVKWKAVQK